MHIVVTCMPIHAQFITADLSTYDVIQIPGPPVFQRATSKNWEWPGDEANEPKINVVFHQILLLGEGGVWARD